ncbi:odorant receptor 10-like [Ptiloglossa arizonensis]|uniref:odorant receptor 10-like n=1 Tax=Ptiloglossa arizonensis TaxID=3350558 RepID=UPI003FA034D6
MQQSRTELAKSQSTDREFDKYMNLSIKWNRWLLKSIGVWPLSSNISRTKRYFNLMLNAICYCLISFLCIPYIVYGLLEVENVYNRLRLFGPLSFFAMAYLKYYSLIFHENDIRECVEHIKWDWKNINHIEDRDIMVANANFSRQLMKICSVFVYGGFVIYYIAVPIKIGTIEAEGENLTFIPMLFPFSRFIVDPRQSPANEILFSIQFIGGALIHCIAAAGCSLAAVFVVHACGQMKVLMCWLGHLIHGRPDMCKTVDGRLANIVKQHVRVLRFLSNTEKVLRQISFVEFTGCTMNLCLLGYYLIMEWESNDLAISASYIVILMSFLFNIFIFCYIGELAAELCKKIGEVSYMVEWYRLTGNKRLSFVLIIAMSNSSMNLTAGNMVILSLTTFSDVVKTSIAFLNMLRAVT